MTASSEPTPERPLKVSNHAEALGTYVLHDGAIHKVVAIATDPVYTLEPVYIDTYDPSLTENVSIVYGSGDWDASVRRVPTPEGR